MEEIQYRIRGDMHLVHAYVSTYKKSAYDPVKRHQKYEDTKVLVGRKARTNNPYGSYKDPYYDPVKRHERYLRERSSKSYGSISSSGSSSGRSGGRKGGSGGKGSKGSGSKSDISKKIAELRNASNLETEAQREAARLQIAELRESLQKQIKKLRQTTYNQNEDEENMAEYRGRVQGLRESISNLQNKSSSEIEKVSKDLSSWISNEKTRLGKQIAKLRGTTYNDGKAEQEARDKKVKSRAQAIYKARKSGKK